MSKSDYKNWEIHRAARDAGRARIDRSELFKDVADIWIHSSGKVRRLIEHETTRYDGSSKESFRTTVSKKILEANRADRTFLDDFDWHGFGILHNGAPPADMFRHHNHHSSVHQKGRFADDALVRKGQDILWDEGIDPLFGGEHLGWASLGVPGQHTTVELKANVAKLGKLQKDGASYNRIATAMKKILKAAADRRPTPAALEKFRQERANKAAQEAAQHASKEAHRPAKKSPSSQSQK